MIGIIKNKIFNNPDVQTLSPSFIRKFKKVDPKFEEVKSSDGNLDLYSHINHSENLIILTHGLEGNIKQHYMQGMLNTFKDADFDVSLWNLRCCGNRKQKVKSLYHGGVIEDLDNVVDFCIATRKYKNIYLIAFSLGGNITLRYLSDEICKNKEQVKGGVSISPPCDLEGSTIQLDKRRNRFYANLFLKSMKQKILTLYNGKNKDRIKNDVVNIKSLVDFNKKITSKIHNFKNDSDYYQKSSSKFYLDKIDKPTLIISSLDDPFLSKSCYPTATDLQNKNITLKLEKTGGHVGFYCHQSKEYLMERWSKDFISGLHFAKSHKVQ